MGSLGVALRLGSCVFVILLTLGAKSLAQTHSDTHTHTWTWQLYDQPGPEGRVGEK